MVKGSGVSKIRDAGHSRFFNYSLERDVLEWMNGAMKNLEFGPKFAARSGACMSMLDD